MDELSTERWFPVHMEPNDVPDELRLMVQFVGTMDDALIEAWSIHAVGPFLALAHAGGLGGAVLAPRIHDVLCDGNWQVWDNETGTRVGWRISDLQVAPEAMRVLVNLCENTMYCFDKHPILEMAIAYGTIAYGRGLPAIDKLDFPGLWPGCPFEVEEYPIESGDFDVEIAFAKKATIKGAQLINEQLSPWLLTVQQGGFGGHPYAQWKPGLETNEKLATVVGQSLVLHLQEFYADPAALLSLRNVLMAIDHAGEKIEAVIIGE